MKRTTPPPVRRIAVDRQPRVVAPRTGTDPANGSIPASSPTARRRAVDQLNIRETLLRAPLGQGEVLRPAKIPPQRPYDSCSV